jgi:hypothetical protein
MMHHDVLGGIDWPIMPAFTEEYPATDPEGEAGPPGQGAQGKGAAYPGDKTKDTAAFRIVGCAADAARSSIQRPGLAAKMYRENVPDTQAGLTAPRPDAAGYITGMPEL